MVQEIQDIVDPPQLQLEEPREQPLGGAGGAAQPGLAAAAAALGADDDDDDLPLELARPEGERLPLEGWRCGV